MMLSKRNQGRNGHRGCFCCSPRMSKSAIRHREDAEWREDAMSDLHASIIEEEITGCQNCADHGGMND